MLEFSSLRELYEITQVRGEAAVALAARENISGVIEGLKRGLVENFDARKGSVRQAFTFQFEVVVFPNGEGTLDFWLDYDAGTDLIKAFDGKIEDPSIRLRGEIGKIIYVVSGTQRDSAVYRSRVLNWWRTGGLIGDGDVMLLQKMQGSF